VHSPKIGEWAQRTSEKNSPDSANWLMTVQSVTKGFDTLLFAMVVHIDSRYGFLWTQEALSRCSAFAVAPQPLARPFFVPHES